LKAGRTEPSTNSSTKKDGSKLQHIKAPEKAILSATPTHRRAQLIQVLALIMIRGKEHNLTSLKLNHVWARHAGSGN
jgi:hypothetical protein